MVQVVKTLTAKGGDTSDMGAIPGLEKATGVGNGQLLQYPGLENPMDREPWWAIAHQVVKSQT